nr:hypothetical protein [Fibrobacter sp. UWT3]
MSKDDNRENFRKKGEKSLIYFPIAVFVGANASNEVLLFQQLQISSDCFFCNAKFFSELLCRRMSVFVFNRSIFLGKKSIKYGEFL